MNMEVRMQESDVLALEKIVRAHFDVVNTDAPMLIAYLLWEVEVQKRGY